MIKQVHLIAALITVASLASAREMPKTVPLPVPRPAMVDINHASASQLQSLKGIGPFLAYKIIKGRPYSGKDDLKNRKVIPGSTYDGISDQIVARQK